MQLTSTAFEHEGQIPQRYTCEGDNVSPPLAFGDIPQLTRSLVLLVTDPDVPKSVREDGMWDHWVVFDIPPDAGGVAEGEQPPGTPGVGTSGDRGYFGPCPPDREHRYDFTLYAVDTRLELDGEPTKTQVLQAMAGHILDKATLMGRYEKKSS